jgi:hypothetical protein
MKQFIYTQIVAIDTMVNQKELVETLNKMHEKM